MSITVEPSAVRHRSAVIDKKLYADVRASVSTIEVFELTLVITPDVTNVAQVDMPKSSGPALPPLLLITDLISVIVA